MSSRRDVLSRHFSVDRRAEMETRDGVVLRAVVHRAAGADAQPVVLVRNPYGEPMSRALPIAAFLDAGFAVVVQDCRGSGNSDGQFVPLENEERDSLDAIEWCRTQDWSDGRVLTYGSSYSGMVQFAAGVRRPAGLVGMIPLVTPADYHGGLAYRGGAFQLGQLSGWYTLKSLQTLLHRRARGGDVSAGMGAFGAHAANPARATVHLPLSEAPFLSEVLGSWTTWLENESRTAYWSDLSYADRRSEIAVPALHVGGWFDLFLPGTLDNFAALRAGAATEEARNGQRLVIGPWSHTDQTGTLGELSFGAGSSAAGVDLEGIVSAFALAAIDATSTATSIPGPPVRLFVMGANRWRDESEWPLARTAWTPWYLRSSGELTVTPPDHTDGVSSSFTHDPGYPVPTRGGQTLMTGGEDGGVGWMPGPRDQRDIESRADVLSFTSTVLDADLEVTGPIEARLWVATDAEDADFTVRLVDVWPDGRALGVVDGIARARYRNGPERAEPLEPGRVYEIEVDVLATSQVFAAGHRIRIDIAGSNFPAFDRNPGRVIPVGDVRSHELRTATQQVFHDPSRPSSVLLPVIPAAAPELSAAGRKN